MSFADPLAALLWRARENARALDGEFATGISVGRARSVADELYARLARTSVLVGWKLGATNAAAQALLDTDRPFTAPIYSSIVLANDQPRILLHEFIAPRLEAEIGLRVAGSTVNLVPCLEVVDCRFPTWHVTLSQAIADFGLQGAFVFADRVTPNLGDPVAVSVTRNGVELQRISTSTVDAVARLQHLAAQLGERDGLDVLVATGTVISPIPLALGAWRVDFGYLGSLSLDVRP